MFTNVLVGVDGRQGGRDAIALANQLVDPGATLTFGNIYANELMPRHLGAAGMALERSEARQLVEREREATKARATTIVAGAWPVGRGLHELAEDLRADLLVVGSSHRALLGRVLLGDDSRAALDGVPCALAVAPGGYAHLDQTIRTIGVGYDESPDSRHALSVARELAARSGANLDVFWVVSFLEVRAEKPIPADWPRAIEDLRRRHADRLAQLPGVHGVVTYGGAREELVRFGTDLDLLIVGSRGYGPVNRLFHGSVSRYLVGHATCPLLVLPRAATVGATERASTTQPAQRAGAAA